MHQHLYSRLESASFPTAILALEHVVACIDECQMSPGEAAVHAARTGQVLWLEKLLPRIQSNKVEIAQDLIETGATNGDCRVIDMAYNWQTRPYQFVGQRKYVPIMLAVRGGHLDAVKCLEPRCWDVTDALHLALETKQEEMVRVLYRKATGPSSTWEHKWDILKWSNCCTAR